MLGYKWTLNVCGILTFPLYCGRFFYKKNCLHVPNSLSRLTPLSAIIVFKSEQLSNQIPTENLRKAN